MDHPNALDPNAQENSSGQRFWRSLEERLDTPAFREMMRHEFPEDAPDWLDPVSRRRFLTLAGASLALAGLSGCYQAPSQKIVPYVKQPEQLVPGKPLYYATAMPFAGSAFGLLVESHEGRPTKIEGNPDHPLTLGASDPILQASILGLWDPDRSQAVTYRGRVRAWDELVLELRNQFRKLKDSNGAGLRILTDAVASPTLVAQLEGVVGTLREAQWIEYEPGQGQGPIEGAAAAFGKPVNVHYNFETADRILSLDADFLGTGPTRLRDARYHARRRSVESGTGAHHLNRLYAVEPTPSLTGLMADHRLALSAAHVETFARLLAHLLEVEGVGKAPDLSEPAMKFLKAVAADLRQHGGHSVVIAGEWQPAAVHVLAHAINDRLGNLGTTVFVTERPVTKARVGEEAMRELVGEMRAGKVDTLLILGGNPVYQVADFAEALERVPLRLHLGAYDDETARLCHWHVPEAHFLETWSDVRAADGTCSVVQPLIAPLYKGRTAHEVVSAFSDEIVKTPYELVRATWQKHRSGGSAALGTFESYWEKAVHDGVIADTTQDPARPTFAAGAVRKAGLDQPQKVPEGVQLLLRPDPSLYDGRYANNAWLQELPKPITKLAWGNAALISPKKARELGVVNTTSYTGGQHGRVVADVVEVTVADRTLRIPAYVLPGQADDVVTLYLGHGRERGGQIAPGVGVSVTPLLSALGGMVGNAVRLARTGGRYDLACTQALHTLAGSDPGDRGQVEERGIIRAGTVEEYDHDRKAPHFVVHAGQDHSAAGEGEGTKRKGLTLFTPHELEQKHQWGMSVDINKCIGCNACVVACQAENNIPTVGKDQVMRGREMHWLRIDRYFVGELEEPERGHFQPVPCMHCEEAPCELVCPVEATTHSEDGLNEMTYNRCVGTRYCQNNCPYKVRRFNFYQFTDYATESLKGLRNPDVTVRTRGVMEKCTYCVQRIRGAEIEAKNRAARAGQPASWRIEDGEVVTACQGACPTRAIIFGDVADRDSHVSKRKALGLSYGLLTELNTRPRTTYLAALTNPNPELKGE